MPRETFVMNGKRYDIKAKTQKELAAKVYAKKKEIEEGSAVVNPDTSVEKWLEKWLETYKKKTVGEATYKNYVTYTKTIINHVGYMKLKDVKDVNLQEILNSLEGHSRSHILKVKQTMEQAFDKAKKNKLIFINPADDLEMVVSEDGNGRSITDKEREIILKVAETHKAGLWIRTMLYTGQRPGETAALQWKSIDLEDGILSVVSARKAVTGEIGKPKSSSGERDIPIPEVLLNDFKRIKAAQGSSYNPFGYVFTQETTGERHTKQSMYYLWKSFKREMNIAMGCKVYRNKLMPINAEMVKNGATPIFPVADDLIPYFLRHTFCTDLQAAGVPINVAKELMGHADISTTSKIYTHKSKASFEAARQCMNKHHAL